MSTHPTYKQSTVVDSETFRPVGHRTSRVDRPSVKNTLDAADAEARRDEINQISPEGAPAHPEFTSRGVLLLILGSMGVVVLLSLVVFAVWGLAAGALVLVFGASLAVFGNPAIWSALLRAEERREIEETHEPDRAS